MDGNSSTGDKPPKPQPPFRWQLSALRVGCVFSWLVYLLPIAVATVFTLICVAPHNRRLDAQLFEVQMIVRAYLLAAVVLLAGTIAVFFAARHR